MKTKNISRDQSQMRCVYENTYIMKRIESSRAKQDNAIGIVEKQDRKLR